MSYKLFFKVDVDCFSTQWATAFIRSGCWSAATTRCSTWRWPLCRRRRRRSSSPSTDPSRPASPSLAKTRRYFLPSVTRLGDVFDFLVTDFIIKSTPSIIVIFGGYFKKYNLHVKKYLASFVNIGKKWLSFYAIIWSHCFYLLEQVQR